MKSVLISIKPKWCEMIANGKKTIEIRKTKPRIDTPFKCYIYCTKEKIIGDFILCKSKELSDLFGFNLTVGVNKGFAKEEDLQLKGKVIGEFVCDRIRPIAILAHIMVSTVDCMHSCLSACEILEYADGKTIYGWNISNLKIYDKPKELSEFYTECKSEIDYKGDWFNYKPLTRPPQSWCYVAEVDE